MSKIVFEPRDFYVLDQSWDRFIDITWKATRYTDSTVSFLGEDDDTGNILFRVNLLFMNKYDNKKGKEYTEVWLELRHQGKTVHKIITYGVYKDVLDVIRQIMWDPYKYARK